MPVIVLRGSPERRLVVEPNANLLVALRAARVVPEAGLLDRACAAILRRRPAGEVEIEVVSGWERLTPPTPCERKRFGGVDHRRRLASQVGIVGEAEIHVAVV